MKLQRLNNISKQLAEIGVYYYSIYLSREIFEDLIEENIKDYGVKMSVQERITRRRSKFVVYNSPYGILMIDKI